MTVKKAINRRCIGMMALLLVIGFYAFGTGFEFFFRFLYVLLLVTSTGFVWAWLNLRGIDIRVTPVSYTHLTLTTKAYV